MDVRAYLVTTSAWFRGLYAMGFDGAHKAAAGLV